MNYRNNEGYASPTEHEALTRIRHEELKEKRQKKYRPIVYICSPFSQGDKKQNIINARRFANMQSLRRYLILSVQSEI